VPDADGTISLPVCRRGEAILSNWQPGEFDLADQEHELLKHIDAEAETLGDCDAACRTIDACNEGHAIRGHR